MAVWHIGIVVNVPHTRIKGSVLLIMMVLLLLQVRIHVVVLVEEWVLIRALLGCRTRVPSMQQSRINIARILRYGIVICVLECCVDVLVL
ncbi:hypothetical protein BDV96DRAFT_573059 [Lophiotrema nucula]|uniref:Uncharacterized protein n=1 Tax=Lophiotrema nucula TaxID=690887 RepID=A0A6A5ZEL6_9PLEO|nr:hypothetical protein BDV96DRAFT_573059 [Lophiotrema nucula]